MLVISVKTESGTAPSPPSTITLLEGIILALRWFLRLYHQQIHCLWQRRCFPSWRQRGPL